MMWHKQMPEVLLLPHWSRIIFLEQQVSKSLIVIKIQKFATDYNTSYFIYL